MPVSYWTYSTQNYPINYVKATGTLYARDIPNALTFINGMVKDFMLILDFTDLNGVTIDLFRNFSSSFMDNKFIKGISLIIKNVFIQKIVETVISLVPNPIPFKIVSDSKKANQFFLDIYTKIEKF
jgi:hypothetical protein